MGEETLAQRLERARAAERNRFKTELGTDDPTALKAQLDELAALKAQQEEAKRAQMSEIERVKADLAARESEIGRLQTELTQERERASYERQDAQVRAIAGEVIAPRFIRTARVEFAEYLNTLSPQQQKRIGEKEVKTWFKQFAKDNPDFAVQAAPAGSGGKPTTPTTPARPAVRRPLTNGASPRGPGATPTTPSTDPSVANGKTVKAGQKNSMSKQELRDFARTNYGVNMP